MNEFDLTTREGVCAILNTSNSSEEWKANVEKIKDANSGNYPDFWFDIVVIGGLCDSIAARWGGSSAITIIDHGRDNT